MASNPHRFFAVASVCLTGLLVGGSGCAAFKDANTKLEEAAIALEDGDEARAEQLYREAMRSKGSESDEARALLVNLLINRGTKLLDAGKGGDAMQYFRDALSLDPARDNSRIAYARALMKVERFTEAIDVLMDGKGCRGCKAMVSVIYIERGLAGVRNGEYGDALEDFDMALSMQRDPLTVLHKVDVYTKGGYGTGLDAVGYLDHALRLMPIDQVGAQQLWWDQRTAVLYTAALNHEDSAINAALALEDPRRDPPPEQKRVDLLNLRMYAASLQIYAKDYEQGIDRGLRTYADAESQGLAGAELDGLRGTLMGLFMQCAAIRLAADEDGAARSILEQGLELDRDNRILNYQRVLATAARSTSSARKLLDKWEGAEGYERMRALVELAYVRKMMEVGQFTAARAGLERAERYAPDLLDGRLARAELEAELRFEGLKKAWVEEFRAIDPFDYPKARINYYGRALAYVRDVQAKYDDAAARDYLRMPAFATRLTALDDRIGEFYPYDARLAEGDKVFLVLTSEYDEETEVKVKGPKQEHVVKVPGGEEKALELPIPGLAVVDAPGGRKPVFAEPGVKIVVEI